MPGREKPSATQTMAPRLLVVGRVPSGQVGSDRQSNHPPRSMTAGGSSVPPAEERILESGTPVSPPYLDLRDCNVNSKAVDERGKVEAPSGCEVASDEAVPTEVDARYRR